MKIFLLQLMIDPFIYGIVARELVRLKSIIAHERSIRGLDWNRIRRTGIVTCSLDKTVKLWDYARGDEPERILRTNTPVWRARHTPFGWGVMTMPKRGDTTLYLWDRRAEGDKPV